jgi:hypothetical protein
MAVTPSMRQVFQKFLLNDAHPWTEHKRSSWALRSLLHCLSKVTQEHIPTASRVVAVRAEVASLR